MTGNNPGIVIQHQENTTKKDSNIIKPDCRILKGDSLKIFVENLKIEIQNDTLKFNNIDLYESNGIIENKNKYSRLYIVNMSYYYMLDVVNSGKVGEFLDEILNVEKIETIYYCEKESCCPILGKIGIVGCVFIKTKDESKVKYKVAGLKFGKKRRSGSNFLSK